MEMSGENRNDFYRLVPFVNRMFSLKDITNNLKLNEPVCFIDQNIFDMYPTYNKYRKEADWDQKQQIEQEIKSKFAIRYNEQVKKENANLPYLDISVLEETEISKMDDNDEVLLHNLYFGTANYDYSGGILGIDFSHVAWFERQNLVWKLGSKVVNVLREIPSGEYVLVDKNGKICSIDEIQRVNDEISINPNSIVRSVDVVSLDKILSDSKEKIQTVTQFSDDNEEYLPIVENTMFNNFYDKNDKVKVSKVFDLNSVVRPLYEFSYGVMFNSNESEVNKSKG